MHIDERVVLCYGSEVQRFKNKTNFRIAKQRATWSCLC